MAKISTMKEALKIAREGKGVPVMSIVKNDPMTAAAITKLVDDGSTKKYDKNGNLSIEAPNLGYLRTRSMSIANDIKTAEEIMAILPDIELSAQVLISSILSPKDLITTEITFENENELMSNTLNTALIEELKGYFENNYRIKDFLYDILERVLFKTGSYPIAVIPENSIDDIINGKSNFSTEAIRREFREDGTTHNLGWLGNPSNSKRYKTTVSTENLRYLNHYKQKDYNQHTFVTIENREYDLNIIVNDNFNVLKLPAIEKIQRDNINKAILKNNGVRTVSFESNVLTDKELRSLLFKNRNRENTPIEVVKTQDQLKRRSVGEPLIMALPSESVIPVYVPGSPNKQIGFFVLLDLNGNPLNKQDSADFNEVMQGIANQPGTFGQAMINQVKRNMFGNDFDCYNPLHLQEITKLYGDIIESNLLSRLRNGAYNSSLKLATNPEIYRIMLARSLKENGTQILWMPVELMTYFAYMYDDGGIGKSLLKQSEMLASLRSMLLFANVRASLRNSIGRTKVEVTLDEQDPDPAKSQELILHEIMRTRQSALPIGMQNPADLVEWITKAGYEINFKGNFGLPEVDIQFSEENSDYVRPDEELDEKLSKQHVMSFGVTPEIIDNINQPEHATSVVNNNILLSKRVIQHQEWFCPLLTDHARKVAINSENLMLSIYNSIMANFEKLELSDELRKRANEDEDVKKSIAGMLAKEWLMTFEIKLPKPKAVSTENQMQELEAYEGLLDKAIENWISSDAINEDMAGGLAGNIDAIKAIVKSYFMRKEMSRSGIMSELSEIIDITSEDRTTNIYAEHKDLTLSLIKGFASFLTSMQKTKTASNDIKEALDNIGEGGDDDYGSSSDDSYSSSDDDSESSDDDMGGGMDDFGGSDDFGDTGDEDGTEEGGDGEAELDIPGF